MRNTNWKPNRQLVYQFLSGTKCFPRGPQARRKGVVLIAVLTCVAVGAALLVLSLRSAIACSRQLRWEHERLQVEFVMDHFRRQTVVVAREMQARLTPNNDSQTADADEGESARESVADSGAVEVATGDAREPPERFVGRIQLDQILPELEESRSAQVHVDLSTELPGFETAQVKINFRLDPNNSVSGDNVVPSLEAILVARVGKGDRMADCVQLSERLYLTESESISVERSK